MVVKLWRKEFSKKKLSLSHSKPENFTRCYFQSSKGIIPQWIGYHGLMACYFSFTFIYTVTPQMQDNKLEIIEKYYIFLTHWTYIFETFYFVLGLIVVAFSAYKEEEEDLLPSPPVIRKKMTWYLKAYWVMHNIVAPCCFTVSIIFWTFIYDPEIFELDANNIFQHGFNSIFMVVHLILIAHPVRILHFYMPAIYVFIYAVFSAIYQLSGGTGAKNSIPIYNILDWRKPHTALLVCTLTLLLLAIMHILLYSLYCFKSYLKKGEKKETV